MLVPAFVLCVGILVSKYRLFAPLAGTNNSGLFYGNTIIRSTTNLQTTLSFVTSIPVTVSSLLICELFFEGLCQKSTISVKIYILSVSVTAFSLFACFESVWRKYKRKIWPTNCSQRSEGDWCIPLIALQARSNNSLTWCPTSTSTAAGSLVKLENIYLVTAETFRVLAVSNLACRPRFIQVPWDCSELRYKISRFLPAWWR